MNLGDVSFDALLVIVDIHLMFAPDNAADYTRHLLQSAISFYEV